MFGSNDQKGFGPMGKMQPGPAMAARMMQMMPAAAANMLSEMSGEDKKTYLLETVGNLVEEITSEMTEEEYATAMKELYESLKNKDRTTEGKQNGCC